MSTIKDVVTCKLCGDPSATIRDPEVPFFCSSCEGGTYKVKNRRLTDLEHGGDGSGTGIYAPWEIPKGLSSFTQTMGVPPYDFNRTHIKASDPLPEAQGCIQNENVSLRSWVSLEDPIHRSLDFTISFTKDHADNNLGDSHFYLGVTHLNRANLSGDPSGSTVVTLRNRFNIGYELKPGNIGKRYDDSNYVPFSHDIVDGSKIKFSRELDNAQFIYTLTVDDVVKDQISVSIDSLETWFYLALHDNIKLCNMKFRIDKITPFTPR